ncbi:hypothetical protein [Natranaerobius thermophilus]|uniref:Lipoprotein n=1 Tax=Natranaerobius thermophilus (strain ATCC BAA-1301 / DSM 18059 / JW/NM-WN-LF) TaxID=457570 RepID=B2A7N4_NATTJ|nr:hypothetical protein [Natranaerobius thermophilus]ACB85741.1 hypothetical protein Nther_2175 [Natranaerobius thermophilus JW/NM-WN-LF]
MKKLALIFALLVFVLGIVVAGCGNQEIDEEPTKENEMKEEEEKQEAEAKDDENEEQDSKDEDKEDKAKEDENDDETTSPEDVSDKDLADYLGKDKFIELFNKKHHEIIDLFGEYDSGGGFAGGYFMRYEDIEVDNPEGIFQIEENLVIWTRRPEDDARVTMVSVDSFGDIKAGETTYEDIDNMTDQDIHIADGGEIAPHTVYYYAGDFLVDFTSESKTAPINSVYISINDEIRDHMSQDKFLEGDDLKEAW